MKTRAPSIAFALLTWAAPAAAHAANQGSVSTIATANVAAPKLTPQAAADVVRNQLRGQDHRIVTSNADHALIAFGSAHGPPTQMVAKVSLGTGEIVLHRLAGPKTSELMKGGAIPKANVDPMSVARERYARSDLWLLHSTPTTATVHVDGWGAMGRNMIVKIDRRSGAILAEADAPANQPRWSNPSGRPPPRLQATPAPTEPSTAQPSVGSSRFIVPLGRTLKQQQLARIVRDAQERGLEVTGIDRTSYASPLKSYRVITVSGGTQADRATFQAQWNGFTR